MRRILKFGDQSRRRTQWLITANTSESAAAIWEDGGNEEGWEYWESGVRVYREEVGSGGVTGSERCGWMDGWMDILLGREEEFFTLSVVF